MSNEIKTNDNNKNIKIKRATQSQKKVVYQNGEKVFIFSKLTVLARTFAIKEKTIHRIKNFISFIIGALMTIIFYIKPINFKEFVNVFLVCIDEIKNLIIFITPFSRKFPLSNDFLYLIKVSSVICFLLGIILYLFLEDMDFHKGKTKFKILISLISFFLAWYINYFVSFWFIKIPFLFKILSFLLISILSIIVYFLILLGLEIIDEYI